MKELITWENATKVVRWGGYILIVGLIFWGIYTITVKIRDAQVEKSTIPDMILDQSKISQ